MDFQLSVTVGDGVMGFRLVDGTKVAVYQIYSADRERDPEHGGNNCRNDKFYGDHFVGHRGSRFDLPRTLDAIFR